MVNQDQENITSGGPPGSIITHGECLPLKDGPGVERQQTDLTEYGQVKEEELVSLWSTCICSSWPITFNSP